MNGGAISDIQARRTEMKKMTTVTAINGIDRSVGGSITSPNGDTLRRWTIALFVSAVLGGVSGLGGLTVGFLTMAELVAPSTNLYTISTVLIGASFLLFGLASHCLDKAEVADKAIRLEYARQHGLKD